MLMRCVEGRDAGIVFDMEELDGHAEKGAGRLEGRDPRVVRLVDRSC
jgi:hypothetical protein